MLDIHARLPLRQVAADFADALATVDRLGDAHKQFLPGIGPFGEEAAVRAALATMRHESPGAYGEAQIKRKPDLLIPEQWAIEFKIIRPFGDNGRPAEHWSENILHPYAGNVSSLGDCLKLISSGTAERKAVIIFGFEHTPPQIPLEPAIQSFEVIARHVVKLALSERIEFLRDGLRHPVHQQLRVYAHEVLGIQERA